MLSIQLDVFRRLVSNASQYWMTMHATRDIARLALVAIFAFSLSPRANAQVATGDEDVPKMVADGMVEALRARFGAAPTPEQMRHLARAKTNIAIKTREAEAREKEFAEAEKLYLACIGAISGAPDQQPAQRAVDAAAARVELCEMFLNRWAATDLDEFELTNGQHVDTEKLLGVLRKARQQAQDAVDTLRPIVERIEAGGADVEAEMLSLGIADRLRRVRMNSLFQRGWSGLYYAIVDARPTESRADTLKQVEKDFLELLSLTRGDDSNARCAMGLAMALREQGRTDEASGYFDTTLKQTQDAKLRAQTQCEWARNEIRAGRFEEARTKLKPLVEKDATNLTPQDAPARFYINLAYLWDANSYLLEADSLTQSASKSPAADAVRKQADKLLEIGFARMKRLAERGDPWPSLTRVFIGGRIKTGRDPKQMSSIELLLTAREIADDKKLDPAIDMLRLGLSRSDLAPDLRGDMEFDLGGLLYRKSQHVEAAEVFEKMARERSDHVKAPEAATLAFQLWAKIAEEKKSPADYTRLAESLKSLLQRYPDHPKREEAEYWLPLALQAAGRFDEAEANFKLIGHSSAKWEEAQYRAAICARQSYEAAREGLQANERAPRAQTAAKALHDYGDGAVQRAPRSSDPQQTRRLGSMALVAAGELYVSDEVNRPQDALNTLDKFEALLPDGDTLGRALIVRLRALRMLKKYDDATTVMNKCLENMPQDASGGMIATIASAMQDETQRLQTEGRADDAQRLAVAALPIFERLEKATAAGKDAAKRLPAARFAHAQMRAIAGDVAGARSVVEELMKLDSRNGAIRRLYAQILTSEIGATPTPEQLVQAREAWSLILRDPGLKDAAPDRYWEARFNLLNLTLRSGDRDGVRQAIAQERVWNPNLGGPHWKPKFEQLEQLAAKP